MAFYSNWFKNQTDGYISGSVPLVNDSSQIKYPTDNYENFSQQGYAKNEIVNACIRELAMGAVAPRYFVGIDGDDGGTTEVVDGGLADLIRQPNDNDDFYTFIERMVTYLQVSGNVYILKERSRTNALLKMWLLRPDRVSIMPNDRGKNAYSYEIDGKEYAIPSEDIAHLALPNPADDVYGLSPLHVLARTVNLDLSMGDFAKTYFQNSGVPSGLLKIKRRLTSQEEANAIRARWRSTFGGVNNMHKVAVLDDDAEYQQMASSPKDMALTELHYMTESRICAVFGVPPILISANVGLARSTFANYREARFSFHSETLEPMINRIVRFLNNCLEYEFEYEGTLRADLTEMKSFLDDRDSMSSRSASLFGAGIITLNEARDIVGFDAVDDGDIRRVPMNIIETNDDFDPIALPEPTQALPESEEELSGYKGIPRIARGAGMLRRDLLKDREDLTDELTADIERFFKKLRSRIDGTIGRYMDRNLDVQKDYPFQWEGLIPDTTEDDLAKILYRRFVKVASQTFARVNDSGVSPAIDFDEKLPEIQAVVTSAGARAKLIHSTTKKRIREAVTNALERGYSIEQLARGVPDDNFKGLRAVATDNLKRARVIARTEVMRTQNLTTNAHYKSNGFLYVRADDVDGDIHDTYVPDGDPYGRTCAERHQQVYHIDDAVNIMDHPNGTLNWEPMPRNYVPDEILGVNLAEFTKEDEWDFPQGVGIEVHKAEVPEYMQNNARKGLEYYKEGLGGAGLTQGTIREARQIASGNISDNKVIRMNAWFARHLTDLDAPQNSDRSHEDFPSAGAVAWYLWGGNPTNPEQAMKWASAEAERIRDKEKIQETSDARV